MKSDYEYYYTARYKIESARERASHNELVQQAIANGNNHRWARVLVKLSKVLIDAGTQLKMYAEAKVAQSVY